MTVELHPRGVFCAALTPLDADFAPDHDRFVDHCRKLLASGCDAIAMLGTTGEANSFSVKERMGLIEAVIAAGIDPRALLPGTGVASIAETIELTKHALSLGVTTVVMLPPFYYKGISDEGLYAAYATIAERIADARLRVVLYHIPQTSAVPITFPVIGRLRRDFPHTFTGIKDSSGDFANMKALVESFPGLAVLAGADPLMLPLLELGGAGCITACANLVAAELKTVFEGFADPSRKAAVAAAQARIVATRKAANTHNQMSTLKAEMARRTGHAGWRTLRPPLTALTAEQERDVFTAFDAIAREPAVA